MFCLFCRLVVSYDVFIKLVVVASPKLLPVFVWYVSFVVCCELLLWVCHVLISVCCVVLVSSYVLYVLCVIHCICLL